MVLDVLGVELENLFEAQGQQSKDQRSWASNCKLVLLTGTKLQLESNYNVYPILVVIALKLVNYLSLNALLQRNGNWYEQKKCLTQNVKPKIFLIKIVNITFEIRFT